MRLGICGAIGMWLLLVTAANAEAVKAPDVGSCAWSQLPPDARQDYLTAFHQSLRDGAGVLSKQDASIRSAVATCSGRSDIPALWMQAAVASQAIQYGAANELRTTAGISAGMLDTAWENAAPEARQCARANAAKAFGITNQPCPDPKAALGFLQLLKLSPESNRAAAVQALYYFNAKAQGEWAEGLIAKFKEKH